MAASVNKVLLLGNLTRDVELKRTASDMAVCDLSLAVTDREKQGDQWVSVPVYVDVTLWGRQAEVAGQYLRKGSQVVIEGKLKFSRWVDNEGVNRTKLSVTGERMQMLGSREEEPKDTSGYSERIHPTDYQTPQIPDDQIPF